MSAFSRTELVHCALVHLSTVGRHADMSLTTGYRGAIEPDHRSLGKVGRTESMPKILTARRREDERERARLYLKSRLMLPTIPLGMVTLLAGYADVVLMWIQDQLTPRALLGSTILFLCGAVWGWGHARYERYLLGTCPEYFARKRSEEHTSELQSRLHLVCRLLLEKKKKNHTATDKIRVAKHGRRITPLYTRPIYSNIRPT